MAATPVSSTLAPGRKIFYKPDMAYKKAGDAHPLLNWLQTREPPMSLYEFARTEDVGICQTALYEHVKGENKNPKADSLMAIQAATGGDVTVQAQLDWLKAHRAP